MINVRLLILRIIFIQKSLALEAPTTTKPVLTTLPSSTAYPKTISDEEIQRRIGELKNWRSVYGGRENMTYTILGNGVEMPVIALGTAINNPSLVQHIVEAAIDMGYRAIDTAYIYGTERAVGDAIRVKINDGTVSREELFVINKLWSTFHRPDLVIKACERSLITMGLTYFDLYLIHNPVSFLEGGDAIPKIANKVQYSAYDYMDTWPSMETLVFSGLVKSIGVSNFNSVQIQDIMDRAVVKPVINQVECHPYLSQQKLDDFCAIRGIKLSCYGVLGSKGTSEEHRGTMPVVMDDPVVKILAAAQKVSAAQLLISWQVNSGRAVVVGTTDTNHLWENLESLSLNTPTHVMKAIKTLNKDSRMFTLKMLGETHRNYPFKIPY